MVIENKPLKINIDNEKLTISIDELDLKSIIEKLNDIADKLSIQSGVKFSEESNDSDKTICDNYQTVEQSTEMELDIDK